jgi:hypothetical protein
MELNGIFIFFNLNSPLLVEDTVFRGSAGWVQMVIENLAFRQSERHSRVS